MLEQAESMKERAREEPLDVSDDFLEMYLDKNKRKLQQFAY